MNFMSYETKMYLVNLACVMYYVSLGYEYSQNGDVVSLDDDYGTIQINLKTGGFRNIGSGLGSFWTEWRDYNPADPTPRLQYKLPEEFQEKRTVEPPLTATFCEEPPLDAVLEEFGGLEPDFDEDEDFSEGFDWDGEDEFE